VGNLRDYRRLAAKEKKLVDDFLAQTGIGTAEFRLHMLNREGSPDAGFFPVFCKRWTESFSPAISIDRTTAEMLLLTDSGDVSLDEAGLPFEVFTVELENCPDALMLKITEDDEVKERPARRLLVQRTESRSEGRVEIYTASDDRSTGAYTSINPSTPSDLGNSVVIKKDGTEIYNDFGSAKNSLAVLLSLRLVTNLGLWLEECKRNRVTGLQPVRTKKRKGRRKVETKDFKVRPVKISPKLGEILGSGGGIEGWKLKTRIIVRGHWKMQPYGPRNSLRYRRWQPPYLKGPKDGPRLPREYEVL